MSRLTAQEWTRANELFHDALNQPEDERDAFLSRVAADAPHIADEVRSLLAFHARADRFLETPAVDLSLDGQQLGPYRVIREVGHGGMGVVYLAEDTRLGRTVALKAIPPEWTDDPERRERLRHEARAAAALSHPGVAVIYALEEIDSHLYLVSEFVRGSSLRDELQHGPLPLSAVLATARDLANALAAAHDRGIVHRDLKPDNVMRTPEGRVKIIDFGVAGFGGADPLPEGTPDYMAPEQRAGTALDTRSDQYAFGVLVHELATGLHPFAGGGTRIPLVAANPLARDLDRILARCMAENPADRFPTTGALIDALSAIEHRDSLRESRPGPTGSAAPGAALFSPLWWWQCHQIITSVGYGAALYFLWTSREILAAPRGLWLFLAGLLGAVTANTFRLHLWFTSRFYPDEWEAERRRAWIWTRLSDFLLGIVLLGAGASHLEHQPGLSALFLGAAILLVIAFAIIEPASTRAAQRQVGR